MEENVGSTYDTNADIEKEAINVIKTQQAKILDLTVIWFVSA